MARGVNKVILIGHLGDAPTVRQMPNGEMVANFSLATTESWRDRQSGQMVERTEWHRVSMYRKLAEIAGQYLHKGSKVYIEGKLQTRKWQDQQGQDRYTTEVVVDITGQMQMLDRRDDMQAGEQYSSAQSFTSAPQHKDFSAPQQSFSQAAPQQSFSPAAPQQSFSSSAASQQSFSSAAPPQQPASVQQNLQPATAAPKPLDNTQSQPAKEAATASAFSEFDDDIPF